MRKVTVLLLSQNCLITITSQSSMCLITILSQSYFALKNFSSVRGELNNLLTILELSHNYLITVLEVSFQHLITVLFCYYTLLLSARGEDLQIVHNQFRLVISMLKYHMLVFKYQKYPTLAKVLHSSLLQIVLQGSYFSHLILWSATALPDNNLKIILL